MTDLPTGPGPAAARKRGVVRGMAALSPIVALSAVLGACSHSGPGVDEPYRVARIFGQQGRGDGEFVFPRALALDGRGHIYVVDKSGRIQKFTTDGAFVLKWELPQYDAGKPDGMCCDAEGNLLVADTHYFQVLKYSPEGRLLQHWGTYGDAPGQFCYVTGVATAPDETIFVSEYGLKDRVQRFRPDGKFVEQFGSSGEGPGQFQRPMNIAVDSRGEVYVADAVNHRIQVFSPTGQFLRRFGSVGAGPGQLRFPYDVKLDADDNVYVTEYGNHRISKFTREGQFLCAWGSPGSSRGQLHCPWGAVVDAAGLVYVADTWNHRVQVFEPRPGAGARVARRPSVPAPHWWAVIAVKGGAAASSPLEVASAGAP
jgi:DNA-binding beta-propeller fold protein YncE